MIIKVNKSAPGVVKTNVLNGIYPTVNINGLSVTSPYIVKLNGINEVSPLVVNVTEQVLKVKATMVSGVKVDKGNTVSGTDIECTAGESLVSHQPIVLVGGLAYKMDYLNPLHQFSFIGFSKTSAISSGLVVVETVKIDLAGWGLLPNQTYMAGEAGGLITTNTRVNSFSKIVGFAQSATSMLIVKDYTSINKL